MSQYWIFTGGQNEFQVSCEQSGLFVCRPRAKYWFKLKTVFEKCVAVSSETSEGAAVPLSRIAYLYWEPADGKYGNHNHNHSGDSLLASAALCWHVTSGRDAAPQTQQHAHVEAANESQRRHVWRGEEQDLLAWCVVIWVMLRHITLTAQKTSVNAV
jgi:hypothetical protein